MQSWTMRKSLSVMLLFLGTAWAQLPERNCMSNPMMAGCPGSEDARKMQEIMNKKPWWEEHPELLNPKVPGSNPSTSKQPTPNQPTSNQASQMPRPNPAADTDWKRPRLARALAADWPRWTFAQPDAGALIGMKLTALVQSPVLGALVGVDAGKQWQASAPQIDEVWVSLRMLPGQKTEAVMLLIGSAVESIATDLRSKGVTVCFLDKRTLLVGEWNAVNLALGRVSVGTLGPMSKRAGELWSSSDLWLIAGRQMVNQVMAANADTAGLTGASMGMSFQNKVAINMLLTAATPAEAARWVSKLKQNPADLGLGEVSIEKTLSGVSVRAAFDPAQMPEALKRQIAEQIRPVLDMAGPAAASAAASGSASSSGAIVIEGLDEGTRTIPLQKR
jgi:hypothetical protein